MKIQIGSINVSIGLSMLSGKTKFEMTVSKDIQPGVIFALNVSYWEGSENPLVIKGEIKSDNPEYMKGEEAK